jgi:hypothetical protein
MKINVLISGIVLLAIGLIMWIIGNQYYSKAYENYVMAKALQFFGSNPITYENAMVFWNSFSVFGFVLFIMGIITAIVGVVVGKDLKYNKVGVIYGKNGMRVNRQYHQPQIIINESQQYYKPEQHEEKTQNVEKKEINNINDKKEQINFCYSCGKKIEGTPIHCYICGAKLR